MLKSSKFLKICFSFILLNFFFLIIAKSQTPNCLVKKSALRSENVINGIWDFKPTFNTNNDDLKSDWGQIWVPGAWVSDEVWWQRVPGIVKKGVDNNWQNLKNAQKAWYRTKVNIPQYWDKSLVEIDLARVSTDAVIYINDKKVGMINWYAGKLDITPFIKFGTENEIKILVIANPNVLLTSHPKEIFITDVFIKTSVRNQMVEAEIELSKLAKPSDIVFINEIIDDKNSVVKKFEQRVNAIAAETQVSCPAIACH